MEYENTSSIRTFLKNKLVRLILVIDVIAIITIAIVSILNMNKSSDVILNITPINADISIDGQSGFTNGTYAVTSGNHTLTIAHEGLESKTFNIDVAPDSVTMVNAFLNGPNGDLSFYEQKVNYESYQKLAEIASTNNNITIDADSSAETFIAKLKHALTISKDLPIKGWVYGAHSGIANAATAGFAIRDGMYREDCVKIACLLVNYYGVDFQDAVKEKIKEAGYDPADYQIIYERYN